MIEYFSRFSLEARNNVKYICIDIYSPYISLVKSIFPESEIVLDKFHIVNLVSRAFNQTRISIMNSLKDDSLKRKLKLFWKLLQKYYSDLCQEPYYCQSFKYKLSSKEKASKQMLTGLNNKIKSIKRTAFGYSNFSNLKKRILIQAGIRSIST